MQPLTCLPFSSAEKQLLTLKGFAQPAQVVPASLSLKRTKGLSFPPPSPSVGGIPLPLLMNEEGQGPGQGGANTCLSTGCTSALILEPFLLILQASGLSLPA